jgi:sulfatase-like protein
MAGREAETAPREAPGALLAFGHLAVLSAFALAQPLFNLLSDNPEFFAARGSSASDIIIFALLLVIVPPAILLALELLIGLAGARARYFAHLLFIAFLAAVVFVQAIKKSIDASDVVIIGLAVALGALAAALYARAEPVRSFLSVLTPAPVVFLVLFLFISPVHKLTIQGEASAKSDTGGRDVPIVMLGFDEFPSTSLLGADGKIDAKRYPGFAELARTGTWFRNAHSIYDSTSKAWPAIMDGDYPKKDSLPTSSDHPNSMFAVLGKSHRMNVSEEATTVCPRDACKDTRLDEPFLDRMKSMADDLGLVYKHVVAPPGIEKNLETVSETWGDFGGGGGGGGGDSASSGGGGGKAKPGSGEGNAANTRNNLQGNRNKRLNDWIDSIRPSSKPSLNFKHVLLPHVPWQYLPDGRQYRRVATEPIPGISRQSYKDPNQRDQLQLRHLLQLGFADLELRRLIKHLKENGMWDKALVVVTADHGVSFRVGQFDRRNVNRKNIDEITPVPLFIKKPGQKKGAINSEVVETTDIWPTMADILNVKIDKDTDGRSAFSREVRDRTQVKMLKRNLSGWIRLPEAELNREKRRVLDLKVRLFGEGKDGPDREFRVGPNQQLIGRPATSAGRSQQKVSLVDAGEYRNVDLKSATLPIWITGRVSGGGGPKDIAVAVNGRVRAVSSTFRLATGGGLIMGVLVPESSMKQGANKVEVFEVVQGGSRLLKMGGT